MTTGRFAEATAVTPAGDGTYSAAVVPGWDIAGNANGGYLLAIGARGAARRHRSAGPVTVTGHFLAPGTPGPVNVTTEVVKKGKRFTTGRATLHVRRPAATGRCSGTFGDLGEDHGALLVDGSPPDLPPIDECAHIVATDTFPPPFMGKVELHLHPGDVGFAAGERSGNARVRGWFQLLDGEPVDSVALLCALDAFPPTIFNTHLPVAWTPTVELTCHVRARPVPGPAALPVHHPVRHRGLPRRGRGDLGRRRTVGRPVTPVGARAPGIGAGHPPRHRRGTTSGGRSNRVARRSGRRSGSGGVGRRSGSGGVDCRDVGRRVTAGPVRGRAPGRRGAGG